MVFGGSLILSGGGCSTGDGLHSAYVSPQIEGRVIDSETQMPIDRVVIIRNPQATKAGMDDYISAGEIQYPQHSIYTKKDGEFKVPSKKNLEVGSDKTWNSVTLKFLHAAYQMYSTNFVHGGADVDGESVLLTGDIQLDPLPASVE